MSKTITVSSPAEFADKLWEMNVHPAMVQLNGMSEKKKALFYGALAGNLFGCMAADFGHARAIHVLRALIDEYARMGGDLAGSATQ